ncbi:chalcone isomerase family protein [Shewanella sp. AS1]|uniref:chalcone isomerase family protein n=1 Tax=Shewanella sp. AS1 TaxID=2907626 RepID=UPI001F16755F|nr:chalcone isomerase family protein [Shewanella sp. AS1]MCE9679487.1 chalcone isomerase family protein [Shewanella sp. AS1]
MLRSFFRLASRSLLVPLLLFSFALSASPLNQLQKIGEGEMTYLFWTLYQAELFAQSVPYQSELAQDKALRIRYYRAIDKGDLIQATADQWQHLGYSDTNIKDWLLPLSQIWPDVEAGDELMLFVTQDGQSHFYFGEQPIGVIPDPRFGEAFLSIWLSKNTSEPRLRKQLLGGE